MQDTWEAVDVMILLRLKTVDCEALSSSLPNHISEKSKPHFLQLLHDFWGHGVSTASTALVEIHTPHSPTVARIFRELAIPLSRIWRTKTSILIQVEVLTLIKQGHDLLIRGFESTVGTGNHTDIMRSIESSSVNTPRIIFFGMGSENYTQGSYKDDEDIPGYQEAPQNITTFGVTVITAEPTLALMYL